MASTLDVAVVLLAFATFVLTAMGIWTHLQGGGIPISKWFGWHPVLMSAAFPFMMTIGRWSYVGFNLKDKGARRQLHRFAMSLSAVATCFGYLAIFMAHLPMRKFFGYDFNKSQWNPDWQRTVHSLFGYFVLFAVLCQAAMGMLKMSAVRKRGIRKFTFHGKLGKIIIWSGAANILLALLFWGWSAGMKTFMSALVVLTACFGTAWPKQEEEKDEEEEQSKDGEEKECLQNGAGSSTGTDEHIGQQVIGRKCLPVEGHMSN